jgi:site-specific recombinase XerD
MRFEGAVEAHLASSGAAEGTAAKKRWQFRRFREFLETACGLEGPLRTSDIRPDQGVPFARWLRQEGGLATGTVDGCLSTVSQFLKWLLAEGEAAFTQEALEAFFRERGGLEPLKRTLPRLPAEGEVTALLAAARAVPVTGNARANLLRLRNIAMLETLRSTGVRTVELVAMRCGDLDFEHQTARVGERVVYCDLEAWGALIHYLQARGVELLPLFSWHRPLFVQHGRSQARGEEQPITPQVVRQMVRKLRGEADVVTPTRLRNRFAARLAASADRESCARLLDVSLRTVVAYEQMLDDE